MVNPLRESTCVCLCICERVRDQIYDKSIQGKSALLQFFMIINVRDLLCYTLCLRGNKYGRISNQMDFFGINKQM